MIPWAIILMKAAWSGAGAVGFSILFNTPRRALVAVFACGFLAGLCKFIVIEPSVFGGVVLASFIASLMVGVAGILIAHLAHVPPITINIPAVIPLVPGAFAYQTMLGLMKLTRSPDETFVQNLSQVVFNGSVTFFVVLFLALGVVLPMLIFRLETVKNVTWFPRKSTSQNNSR